MKTVVELLGKGKNDRIKSNIKGDVLSMNTTIYNAKEKFGEILKVCLSGKQILFNTIGNKIEENLYIFVNGKIHCSISTCKFDSNGKKIEEICRSSDGELKAKSIHAYDTNGNEIEETIYNSDGSVKIKSFYVYDANGNRVEESNYNSEGKLSFKRTYEYDIAGNEVGVNRYNSNGSLLIKYVCQYDVNGNKIEEKRYNSDGNLFSRYIFKYNVEGNLLEENSYEADGSLFCQKTFRYDSDSNLIEWNENYVGDGVENTYKYDTKGNLIEENNYGCPKIVYFYEYDEEGNWIKQIEYKNGVVVEKIIERSFVYIKPNKEERVFVNKVEKLVEGGKTTSKRLKLKGKVKSFVTCIYDAKGISSNVVKEERKLFFKCYFDVEGNQIEGNSYRLDGSLLFKDIYKYDNMGNNIEINRYNLEGNLEFRFTFKYDDSGNKIEENRYNNIEEYKHYLNQCLYSQKTYRNKGDLVEVQEFDSEGSLKFENICKYDKDGNLIEKDSYSVDGGVEFKYTNRYNLNGDLIESDMCGDDFKYTYEYDKKGNWVKQTEYKNKIPQRITERFIAYYD